MEAFEWDAANDWKIERHGLTRDQVEEAFAIDPMEVTVYNKGAEIREGLVGETMSGTVLFVVYTRRGGRVRVITAYPANRRRREMYRRFLS